MKSLLDNQDNNNGPIISNSAPRRQATIDIKGSTSLLRKTKDLSRGRHHDREKHASPTSNSVLHITESFDHTVHDPLAPGNSSSILHEVK